MTIRNEYTRMGSLLYQKKELDCEIKTIRDFLKDKIPPGEEEDGIRHLTHETYVVDYPDALSRIIERLVPKSKRPAAYAIMVQHTRKETYHTFEKESHTDDL